ncbi:MAG: potassium-transporting ATPase subunit KdpC [Sulfuricurvum sp.]|uniref:potassium-transporting ATPase subunit KdpC n=1 Tax=Sulfuricurvum sp. TaxID=2025608 RepID=UPI00262FE173|nr:potassium-transporting ATPase subunit KdpC [Sulfuricurvum sp.]MDD5158555.1 potassium-transporting ATPase subunit KdpC [Sulfuricurvum sp.]
MFKEIEKSVLLFSGLTLICALAYPFAINAIGAGAFADKADGSLVYKGKTPIASTLIAQNFTQPYYFHPRPSAAGADGYDGTSSSGSNLGYTSQKLHDAIKGRVETYRTENNLSATQKVPMDAVTTSASGLDPHITVANALIQAKRVAIARGIDETQVINILHKNIQQPYWGIIGKEKVNVLNLNLILDRKFGKVKI